MAVTKIETVDAEDRLAAKERERNSPRCGVGWDPFYWFRSSAERARIDARIDARCAALDVEIRNLAELLVGYSERAQQAELQSEIEQTRIKAERDVAEALATGSTDTQAAWGAVEGVVGSVSDIFAYTTGASQLQSAAGALGAAKQPAPVAGGVVSGQQPAPIAQSIDPVVVGVGVAAVALAGFYALRR